MPCFREIALSRFVCSNVDSILPDCIDSRGKTCCYLYVTNPARHSEERDRTRKMEFSVFVAKHSVENRHFFHEIVLVRLTASCQIALKLRVGLADISMSKSQRDTERKHTDLPGWSTAYLLPNIRWKIATHGIILVYGVVFVRDVVRTAQSKKSFADPPRIWSYAWRAWRACWRA